MLGETISHYKILEKLGEGGMGEVYRARDTKLERDVAIKILKSHLSSDPEAVKRFVQEAKAASALNHSAIGVIYEIDETEEGQTFIAMALYEGGTLREKIDSGKMTSNEAVTIASQIASGLARTHEEGIVHRDIKPQNILLSRDGEAKIIDFGLAKLAGRTKLTRDGSTLGTAAYMSPEQARGEEIDHRTDIFSLGTILYEMLAGETPFRGDHEAALLYGIVHEEPEAISEKCQGIDPQLCRVIESALMKDPTGRYQSVSKMKDDLKELQASTVIQETERTSSSTGPGPSRRNLGIGIAAVVIVAILFGYLLISKREPAQLTASEMSLAVMDFRDMSALGDSLRSPWLTELLATALMEFCPIRVKSPEYLRDIKRRKYGSRRTGVEEGQELEIADESGATYALTGSIAIRGDEGFVAWRLIDLRSKEGIGGGRIKPGEMNSMADEIVSEVLAKISGSSGLQQSQEQVPVEQLTTSSAAAYRHYVLGMLWISQLRIEDARDEFKLAISEDESFALAYFQLARTYFGGATVAPNIAKAREYAAATWKYEDKLGSKEKFLLEAFQHGLDYEVTLEMNMLRDGMERWPDDKEILKFIQARAYWWWYYNDIVEIADMALDLYPDDHLLQGNDITQALINLGREDEGCRKAKEYLEKEPDDPNGWDVLALSYLALGYPDSAEAAYRKAVELDSDWSPRVFANCAFFRGELDRSISMMEGLIAESNPAEEDAIAYLMYAFTHSIYMPALYFEAGRYSDALRIMEESRKYVEDDPTFWQYQAGRLYSCVGKADKALEISREMENSDEVRARVFAMRFKGLAHVAAGDLVRARATAKRTHELAETSGQFISYPAYKLDAAIALMENDAPAAFKALSKMSEIGYIFNGMIALDQRDMFAEAYTIAGKTGKAIETHIATLRVYRGHAISHYKLGLLYEKAGKPEMAVTHFERFLKMWKNADEGLSQPAHARERLAALKGI